LVLREKEIIKTKNMLKDDLSKNEDMIKKLKDER